jgi:hypothetical protein
VPLTHAPSRHGTSAEHASPAPPARLQVPAAQNNCSAQLAAIVLQGWFSSGTGRHTFAVLLQMRPDAQPSNLHAPLCATSDWQVPENASPAQYVPCAQCDIAPQLWPEVRVNEATTWQEPSRHRASGSRHGERNFSGVHAAPFDTAEVQVPF